MTIDPNREAFFEPLSTNEALNAAVMPLLSQAYDKGYNAALEHAATKTEHAKNKPPLIVNHDGSIQKMSCAECDALREQVAILRDGLVIAERHLALMVEIKRPTKAVKEAALYCKKALTNAKQLGKE